MNSKLFRTGAVGLMLALSAAPCWAQAVPNATIDFNIPAEPLGKALEAFAAQTHQQLLFASDSVAGRNAPAIKGRFTPDAVLKRLLTGSGLQAQRAGPTSLVLKPATSEPAPRRAASAAVQTTRPLSPPSGGLAQADTVAAPVDAAPPETVQEVTVTGSHIRGVQLSSPVVTNGGVSFDGCLEGALLVISAPAECVRNSGARVQETGTEAAERTAPSVAPSPTKGASAAT